MTIGEFDEEGNLVRAIACDDAVIVVGTAIDPEMQDEMRVTVVATGLGDKSAHLTMVKADRNEVQEVRVVNGPSITLEEEVRPESSPLSNPPRPARVRQVGSLSPVSDTDIDYLDIPAFLRRQAD